MDKSQRVRLHADDLVVFLGLPFCCLCFLYLLAGAEMQAAVGKLIATHIIWFGIGFLLLLSPIILSPWSASFSWRLILRIIAALLWIVSILGHIVEPGFEFSWTFLAGVVAFLWSFAASDAPVSIAIRDGLDEKTIRRGMLELVEDFWVKGVLEKSLYGATMIELDIEERPAGEPEMEASSEEVPTLTEPEAMPFDVPPPLESVIRKPTLRPELAAMLFPPQMKIPTWLEELPEEEVAEPKPRSIEIVRIFNRMNQALLILGEPGSGKTTTLLELARDAIVRAKEDPTQPVPLVFNLSSWAEKRQSISDWLLDELDTTYKIPKTVALPLVENDDQNNALMLLLDGLDEVRAGCRDACVKAINEFRSEHESTPIVVCSRLAGCEAQTTQLKLKGAAVLQRLTPQQVDQYLDGPGAELVVVRRTLKHNPTLQGLAESPLMLSIITLAHQGISARDSEPSGTIELRRRYVLGAFVHQMLEQRGGREHYAAEQTVRWLMWLAQKMSQYGQTVISIERMQPKWLRTSAERRLHAALSILVCMLISGLSIGATLGPLAWLVPRPIPGPIPGVVSGPLGWVGLWLSTGMIWGLLGALTVWTRAGLLARVLEPMGGLMFRLLGGLSHKGIEVRAILSQGIRRAAASGIVTGLSAGLMALAIIGLIFGPRIELIPAGSLVGLYLGLICGGFASIQHLALRSILYLRGHIPWNYARFLDYAAKLGFLRKVGSGYMFAHHLLREYFAEAGARTPELHYDELLLEKSNEVKTIPATSIAHYLAYAESYIQPSAANYDALEAECSSLVSAMTKAYQEKEWGQVCRFAQAMHRFLYVRGYWKEYCTCLEQAICAADRKDCRKIAAGFTVRLGRLAVATGEYAAAQFLFQRSLNIGEELENQRIIASALNGLGVVALEMGDYVEAQYLCQRSLDISEMLGDQDLIWRPLCNLGILTGATVGSHAEVQRLLQRSLDITQELGDPSDVSAVLGSLGYAYIEDDRIQAERLIRQALALAATVGDVQMTSIHSYRLALVCIEQKRFAEALPLLQQTVAISARLGTVDLRVAKGVLGYVRFITRLGRVGRGIHELTPIDWTPFR